MESVIATSELVLNADGSVYHLNLLPGEVADIIILVGDPNRVAEVSKHFDRIDIKKSKRELVTHTGWIGKKHLSVVGTGMGVGNIDIVMNELDALFNIDLHARSVKPNPQKLQFIRLGTSGALHPDLPVDTCLVSQYAVGMDALVNYYDWKNTADEAALLKICQTVFAGQAFQASLYTARGAASLMQKFQGDLFARRGITLTCPGFYGPQGRVLRAKLADADYLSLAKEIQFDHLAMTNLEMETAAIYGLARLLNHDACSISAIIANRELKTFSKNPQQIVDKMIIGALECL